MSVTFSGSLAVTGSVIANSFTGSLQGTASYASSAGGGIQGSQIYSYTFLLMGS